MPSKKRGILTNLVGGSYLTTLLTPGNKPFDVYKNPSFSELKTELGMNEGKVVRVLAVGDDLLCWKAGYATHDDVIQMLGLYNDRVMEIVFRPNNAPIQSLTRKLGPEPPKPEGFTIELNVFGTWPPINWETHPFFVARPRIFSTQQITIRDGRQSSYWKGFPALPWGLAKLYAESKENHPNLSPHDILEVLKMNGHQISGRRTADKMDASVKQLWALAKRDVLAALRHPNASPEMLVAWLSSPNPKVSLSARVEALKSNPVFGLMALESPADDDKLLVELWKRDAESLLNKIRPMLARMSHHDYVFTCLDAASSVLPLFEARYPDDYRPAEALEAARQWWVAKVSTEYVTAAIRECNQALVMCMNLDDRVGDLVANACAHAASSVKTEYRNVEAVELSAKAAATVVAKEETWPWYHAQAEKLRQILGQIEQRTAIGGRKVTICTPCGVKTLSAPKKNRPLPRKKQQQVIQSILIDKDYAPELAVAKKWVRLMGGKILKVDETENFWRFRQHDPKHFVKNSFRTHHPTHGVRVLIARPLPTFHEAFLSEVQE